MSGAPRRTPRGGFVPISIAKYIPPSHEEQSRRAACRARRPRFRESLEVAERGSGCECGEPIWVLGSAIVGRGCFTYCITGQSWGPSTSSPEREVNGAHGQGNPDPKAPRKTILSHRRRWALSAGVRSGVRLARGALTRTFARKRALLFGGKFVCHGIYRSRAVTALSAGVLMMLSPPGAPTTA